LARSERGANTQYERGWRVCREHFVGTCAKMAPGHHCDPPPPRGGLIWGRYLVLYYSVSPKLMCLQGGIDPPPLPPVKHPLFRGFRQKPHIRQYLSPHFATKSRYLVNDIRSSPSYHSPPSSQVANSCHRSETYYFNISYLLITFTILRAYRVPTSYKGSPDPFCPPDLSRSILGDFRTFKKQRKVDFRTPA
jgi:hypothetical protein